MVVCQEVIYFLKLGTKKHGVEKKKFLTGIF